MEVEHIRKIALELMEEHKVKYGFRFATAIYGDYIACVNHMNQKIQFNTIYAQTITESELRKVMLHEIAHYLVEGHHKKSHGHDKVWRSKCKEIGGHSEEKFAFMKKIKIEARFIYQCSACKELGQFPRRITNDNYHYGCPKKKENARGEQSTFILKYDRKGQFAPMPE